MRQHNPGHTFFTVMLGFVALAALMIGRLWLDASHCELSAAQVAGVRSERAHSHPNHIQLTLVRVPGPSGDTVETKYWCADRYTASRLVKE